MQQGRKKGRTVKVVAMVAVLLMVALLLLTPAVQSFLRDLVTSPFNPRYPESATFTLQRSLTIDANGCDVIGYSFDLSEPETIVQDGFTIQNVTSIVYAPDVTHHEERYGQKWIVWNGSGLAGDQTSTSFVTYEVTMRTKIWDIDRDTSRDISPSHPTSRPSTCMTSGAMVRGSPRST
jgi:hypothetical protein